MNPNPAARFLPGDSRPRWAVAERLLAFERYYESLAQPFEWTFTRRDLTQLLQKVDRRESAALPAAA